MHLNCAWTEAHPAPAAADQAVAHAALHVARGGANVAVAVAVPVCILALAAVVSLFVIVQQGPARVHLQVCNATKPLSVA